MTATFSSRFSGKRFYRNGLVTSRDKQPSLRCMTKNMKVGIFSTLICVSRSFLLKTVFEKKKSGPNQYAIPISINNTVNCSPASFPCGIFDCRRWTRIYKAAGEEADTQHVCDGNLVAVTFFLTRLNYYFPSCSVFHPISLSWFGKAVLLRWTTKADDRLHTLSWTFVWRIYKKKPFNVTLMTSPCSGSITLKRFYHKLHGKLITCWFV